MASMGDAIKKIATGLVLAGMVGLGYLAANNPRAYTSLSTDARQSVFWILGVIVGLGILNIFIGLITFTATVLDKDYGDDAEYIKKQANEFANSSKESGQTLVKVIGLAVIILLYFFVLDTVSQAMHPEFYAALASS